MGELLPIRQDFTSSDRKPKQCLNNYDIRQNKVNTPGMYKWSPETPKVKLRKTGKPNKDFFFFEGERILKNKLRMELFQRGQREKVVKLR